MERRRSRVGMVSGGASFLSDGWVDLIWIVAWNLLFFPGSSFKPQWKVCHAPSEIFLNKPDHLEVSLRILAFSKNSISGSI